jgi:hypothetical protein
MKPQYVLIELIGGGQYAQPVSEIASAIDGELDGVEIGESITLKLTPLAMTKEEYEALPDFEGH